MPPRKRTRAAASKANGKGKAKVTDDAAKTNSQPARAVERAASPADSENLVLVYGPNLPPDVERTILELVARRSTAEAAVLSSLCKRVHSWIEPILYTHLPIIDPSTKSHRALLEMLMIPDRVASISPSVRSLGIPHSAHPEDIAALLAACPAVENLAFWPLVEGAQLTRQLLYALLVLRPVRLHIRLQHLLPPTPDFSLPLFSRVTHLELADAPTSWSRWPGAVWAQLKALTHLQLFCPRAEGTRGALRQVLARVPALRVLILDATPVSERHMLGPALENVEDPRMVVIKWTPQRSAALRWEAQALGKRDQWQAAEEMIKQGVRMATYHVSKRGIFRWKLEDTIPGSRAHVRCNRELTIGGNF